MKQKIINMDLIKALSEISRVNEKYNEDRVSIERRLGMFSQELEFIAKELEITEMAAFFFTAMFKLEANKKENIFFLDVVYELKFNEIRALRYYNAIEVLEEKGLLTKIIHNEKSLKDIYREFSIIPYYNEEYKLTKKAIDKIIK